MRLMISNKNQDGFALLEVLVALTIMAIVGLMAWRGMDVMIRGSEIIEHRTNQEAVYFRLVQQFDRDCLEILRSQELGSTPVSYGAKNIWWLRHFWADGNDAWLLVGYGMSALGLQRWTSQILTSRLEVDSVWVDIKRDPDLVPTNLQSTMEMLAVSQQTFLVSASPGITGAELNRGISIQWHIRGARFPITRSCLIGDSL